MDNCRNRRLRTTGSMIDAALSWQRKPKDKSKGD